MIISRTPFRVSFLGGGSDLQEFYAQHGFGAVVGATLQQYMYIVIHPYFHDKIRIKYSQTEDVESVDEIKHPIVRECLRKVNIERGIEIASFADIPAGTGLGSSSAFTVGLLNTLYAFKGKHVSKERLAREACEIEIDILGAPIGKQDQYLAAFGNVNYVRFNANESVDVSPVLLTEAMRKELEHSLVLLYLGGERKAEDILVQQKQRTQDGRIVGSLIKLVALADELRVRLNDGCTECLGPLLHRAWLLKREMAPGISSVEIDGMYDRVRALGATGGKLLGAGGAGFFLAHFKDGTSIADNLHCKKIPFRIDREGSKVIYYE